MSIATMIARSGHTIAVLGDVPGLDELGARVTNLVLVDQSIPSWVQPASSETREVYGRRDLVVTSTIYVAQDLSLTEGSVIVFEEECLVVRGVEDQAGLGQLWAIHVEEKK